jgi:hypothetical protein
MFVSTPATIAASFGTASIRHWASLFVCARCRPTPTARRGHAAPPKRSSIDDWKRQRWSTDFMAESLADGRAFRTLNRR